MKIDEATIDTDITGVEKIPVSDGGNARAITTDALRSFIVGSILSSAEASGIDLDADQAMIVAGGVIKRIDADALAGAILDYGFGLTGVVTLNGNEKFGINDAGTKKTVTLEGVRDWLEDNMTIDADIDFTGIDTASGVLDPDGTYLVLGIGSSDKKISIAGFSEWVHNRFAAFAEGLTSAASVTGNDVVYIIQGGNAKKCTVSQIATAIGAGDVKGPSTTTENNIPQWDSVSKTLKDGVALVNSVSDTPTGTKIPTEGAVRGAISAAGDVKGPSSTTQGKIPVWDSTQKKLADGMSTVTSVRSSSDASDTAIPTEKAIRTALDANGGVGCSETTAAGNVPVWDSTQKVLRSGKPLVTSVRSSAMASDDAIPTEKAVRQVADGFISASGSHTENAIPVWGADSSLKGGKSVTNVIGSDGSNDNIPTEKAVRDALPVAATSQNDGLMTAADKSKLDSMVNTGAVEEIGKSLDDADTIVVKDNDSVYRKSLLTRFWTYILGKLPSVSLETFTGALDTTKNDASTTAHGLLPKLPGDTDKFLRGDGSFAAPSGSSPFTGDSGSGGEQGLVPAPSAGSAAANKFLCADGTWAVTPAAAGVDIPGSGAVDSLDGADALYVYDASEGEYHNVSASDLAKFVGSRTRYNTMFVPAGAFTPSTNSGATMSAIRFSDNTHDVVSFAQDSDTSAEFNVALPDGWDEGSVKARVYWTTNSSSGEAGQTVKFFVGAVNFRDADAISTSPESFADVSDSMLAANEMHISSPSTVQIEGTAGDGHFVHFKFGRHVDDGTLLQPVQVLGIEIQFAENDITEAW